MTTITMLIDDSEKDQKTSSVYRVLNSVINTVNLNKYGCSLIIIDNSCCKQTKKVIREIQENYKLFSKNEFEIIILDKKLSESDAVNIAWKKDRDKWAKEFRDFPVEWNNYLKIGTDIIFNTKGWVGQMVQYINSDESIGQISIKPKNANTINCDLRYLTNKENGNFQVIENVKHINSSCIMYSGNLLEKIGYLDNKSKDINKTMSNRSLKAGFYNCLIPAIDTDHI